VAAVSERPQAAGGSADQRSASAQFPGSAVGGAAPGGRELRLAAIATPAGPVASPEAWCSALEAPVRAAAEAGASVAVLGEYVTAPLAALDPDWSRWTPLWETTARRFAATYGLHLLAGTHLVRERSQLFNRALLAHPDRSLSVQDKLHPTPWERAWGVAATARLTLVDVGAPAAVLVCYDVEFPEACRAAALAGAEILLVPSWTDDRAGFLRVRRCAAARAVENVVAVVHSPLVGGLPLEGFERAAGAAAIITPCDDHFPAEGFAAEGLWNQFGPAVGTIDLNALRRARAAGTVTPLADRRALGDYSVG
jgi:predicted amidohydrolase